VESCRGWLCQGDLFADVPILQIQPTLLEPKPVIKRGLSVLVTYDCQLDKRTSRNAPKITWMQFAPVRPMADLAAADERVKRDLRNGKLNFPEAVFIEESFIGEECVMLLSELYSLPSSYFGIDIRETDGEFEAGEDRFRAFANQNAERVCTMTEAERTLLRAKMIVFWTGLQPGTA